MNHNERMDALADYFRSPDVRNRNRLIECCLDYARKVAGKYAGNSHNKVKVAAFDELYSMSCEALMKAISEYRFPAETTSVGEDVLRSFERYVWVTTWNRMKDCLRRDSCILDSQYKFKKDGFSLTSLSDLGDSVSFNKGVTKEEVVKIIEDLCIESGLGVREEKALKQHVVDECSWKEIASNLGCSITTAHEIKSRIVRSIGMLPEWDVLDQINAARGKRIRSSSRPGKQYRVSG
jgi:RNA polymerase sigma factor (sigma-70 family)